MKDWEPWIKHLPGPCPLKAGQRAQIECKYRDGKIKTGEAVLTEAAVNCPAWQMVDEFGPWNMITRYRIRRSRGMAVLESIATEPERKLEGTE